METYDFVPDESGIWFFQSRDSPDFANIRVEQGDDDWKLFVEGEEEDLEMIKLKNMSHLLNILNERGCLDQDQEDDADQLP